MHRFVLHNDEIRPAEEACLTTGQVGFQTGWGVFSTIRVSRSVLFAFERHFARMERDARMLRVPFPESPAWLESRLLKLVEANKASEATLRVNIVRNRGGLFEGPDLRRPFEVVAFTANLVSWGSSVRLGVEPNARHAASKFAGTKVTSWMFNLNLYEEAHERGLDEVILLNEREEVSECTSANVFAAFGDRVLTPPLNSGCLAGITRELLLSEVKAPGITVEESTLRLEDLHRADEVFITSTTRDVLAAESLEGRALGGSRDVSQKLGQAFRQYIDEYVSSRTLVS